jgi:MerR family transcriptional regulator, copper efflux regulator
MPSSLSPTELARLTGVSTDTLRHYERKRVLPPPGRLPNGYRRYPADAVARVQLVKRALRIGFSLEELAHVLAERHRGGAPCEGVRALVAERLRELEQTLRELTTLRRELQGLLRDWDRRLASTPRGTQARLLDALATPSSSGAKANRSPWGRSVPAPRRLRAR